MDRLTKEAVRYLGYNNNPVDTQTLNLIKEAFLELKSVARMRSICRVFNLKIEEDRLLFADISTNSRSLARNLNECEKVILFGATLGSEVDRLIDRMSIMDMAKAVVLQACAAALLEEYCDNCQDDLTVKLKKEKYFLRPRFSPGYGDFSIEYQKNIIHLLDSAKRIGLTITDSYMMSPKKSVTAVIGLSRYDRECSKSGCEVCEKTNCIFRRNKE